MPIATLQIQSAAFRFLINCRDDDKKAGNVISTILTFITIVSFACAVILLLVLQKIPFITRIAVCSYFLADMFLAVMQQIARGLAKNKDYSIGAILSSGINLLGIIAVVHFKGQGLLGVLISMIVGTAISVIYLMVRIPIRRYYDFKLFSKLKLKEMLSYSWPMIPNNLSNWVLRLSDRLVITAVIGIEANAVYAVANKIPGLFSIVNATFGYAWQESASLSVNDEDAKKYYSNIFAKTFDILVGVMALLIAFTPLMFKLLIRGDYGAAYGQMPILFMGMMFACTASVLGGIYVAHKKTKSVGVTTTIAAAVNLLIDLIFVKSIGITAGSISTLVSYLFLTIYRMIDVQKFQRVEYNWRKIFMWLSVLILMLIVCELNILLLNIGNAFVGIIVAFLSNRETVKKVFIRLQRGKHNGS